MRALVLPLLLIGCRDDRATKAPADDTVDADGDGIPASEDCDDSDPALAEQEERFEGALGKDDAAGFCEGRCWVTVGATST